uniref:HNH nuclease domain-containing protein n=1 Tax=viral metagenome TaxID=1070528 RepID=A0A6C0DS30_9ZZZZ
MDSIQYTRDEHVAAINEMFERPKDGSLTYYFKEFLLQKCDEWWSQPEAQAYCNKRVAEDGGVGWNTKVGGKKNPDGTPATYGDPGRTLEAIRTEKYDGCWDNQTGKKDGPFRLNLEKYKQHTGSTKCHSFSEKDKKEIRNRSGGKCELCGYKGKVEIDHFIPREKGGLSSLENGNALCSRCNDRKCAKTPDQFMQEEIARMNKYFIERGMAAEFKNAVREICKIE